MAAIRVHDEVKLERGTILILLRFANDCLKQGQVFGSARIKRYEMAWHWNVVQARYLKKQERVPAAGSSSFFSFSACPRRTTQAI